MEKVISLGCRLNAAEGEAIAALLPDDGDLFVVNGCGVTGSALADTRRAVRRLARARPGARIAVTGCAAELDGAALAALPGVERVVPNARKLAPAAYGLPASTLPRRLARPARTRAFVPVQNGCDHRCTFCAIWQARGPSRSLPAAAVVRAVAEAVDGGAREVVLTGVDITAWGADLAPASTLGRLVETVLVAVPGLARLRLSSLDGIEIDPLLFELLVAEPRMAPHVHLSLQAGDDMVLKRMRRRHDRASAVRLVARLKAARPGIAIGADLIAGFPTETPAMFAGTLSLIEDCAIVHAHVFPFSPRPGTPAARMPQVDPATVRARAALLRERAADSASAWRAGLTGTRTLR